TRSTVLACAPREFRSVRFTLSISSALVYEIYELLISLQSTPARSQSPLQSNRRNEGHPRIAELVAFTRWILHPGRRHYACLVVAGGRGRCSDRRSASVERT